MGQTVISYDGRFAWDAVKSEMNRKKHGLAFDEVLDMFSDPFMLEIYDEPHSSFFEQRNMGIARWKNQVLTSAYAEHGSRIRIITVRKSTPKEEEAFYGYIEKNLL